MIHSFKRITSLVVPLALLGFSLPVASQPTVCSPPANSGIQTITDVALTTGFQDTQLGHFTKGRATVAADFNLDNRIDFFLGNPRDESVLLRNDFPANFLVTDMNLIDELDMTMTDLAWGAAAADYDNDGDYDLYVSNGGNECDGFDKLLRNDLVGAMPFTDVTDDSMIKGPILEGNTEPTPMASGNGVWGDYDQDGWVDLFVNGNNHVACGPLSESYGVNTLWRNKGNGEFEDVTNASGLRGDPSQQPFLYTHKRPSRHSTFFDFDNDGDLDLYEQNDRGDGIPADEGNNVLWENINGVFTDVTMAVSMAGSMGDLRRSEGSFSSCAGDFNNDGWEDLMVFTRSIDGTSDKGHYIFLNEGGLSFRELNVAPEINAGFNELGVMGSQIGDLNGDGVLDIFMGNGGPSSGEVNRLFLSTSEPNADPTYVDASGAIHCTAPEDGVKTYPLYPYRTHGTVMVDVDNDATGTLELVINNGGPGPSSHQEPNRLFKFTWQEEFNWFKIRPIGDGVLVSKDGIGTRLALTVSNTNTQESWTLHRTLYGGSCFSAQNGFEVYFGLADANSVDSLTVRWADGVEQTSAFTNNAVDRAIVIERGVPPFQ